MKVNWKKVVCASLALAMSASVLSGCGGKNTAEDDGRVVITIGDCPSEETSPEGYKAMVERIAAFEKNHPDIKVEMDTWTFDTKSYTAKAEGGTLPTVYYLPLTEAKNVIKNGYAADITDEYKSRGFYDEVNDYMLDLISEDGRIYFLTSGNYDIGLGMNMEYMSQVGYVEEDGTPKAPKDWNEFAQMAVKLKETTGKAGFIMPTTENCGGWWFTPIAWSFGVEFMKQDNDGKWNATFDTPEMVEALQFMKDLKWKYGVLPANTLIGLNEVGKQMGTGEVAMAFAEQNRTDNFIVNGMKADNIGMVPLPAGPAKKISLMGGSIDAINKDATPEQIKAVFDWKIEAYNAGVVLTDAAKEGIEKNIKERTEKGYIVGIESVSPWKSDCEAMKYMSDQYKAKTNINLNHVKLYNDKTGMTFQAEEPVEAQALYSILDSCLQEVLTNKDADCASLVSKAAKDFQVNYLD